MDSCRYLRAGTNKTDELLLMEYAREKSHSNRKKLFGLAVLTLLFCIGCQSTPKQNAPLVSQTPNYLSPGDVVKISFPAAPELNQTQKLGPDGALSLPLVGEVHAAGKSPAQLQTELANLYKPQLQDNEVLVTLETRALPIVVSGAVAKPGKIVFERPATVLEAIMEAGGFTPEADLKRVSVIRIVKGEPSPYPRNARVGQAVTPGMQRGIRLVSFDIISRLTALCIDATAAWSSAPQ